MDTDFDLGTALDEYADLLVEVEGIRSASADPAKIMTPGVWVQARSFKFATLDGGVTIDARLLLITGSKDPRRAITDLSALFRAVVTLGQPAGEMTPAVATLNGADLPALSVPVRIRWSPEP